MTDQLPPVIVNPQHCGQTMQPKPITGYTGPVTRWHCDACDIDMMVAWASPDDLQRAAMSAFALSAMINPAPCDEFIWHGPGHQSRTRCRLKGDHDVHEAIYGEFQTYAKWRSKPDGRATFSGVFDEPPTVED